MADARELAPIPAVDGVDARRFRDEILPSGRPVVLSGQPPQR